MTSAPEAHKTAGVLIDRDRLAFIIGSNLDCTAEVASITGIGEAADEILAEIEDALLFSTPSVPAIAELSGDGLPPVTASGAGGGWRPKVKALEWRHRSWGISPWLGSGEIGREYFVGEMDGVAYWRANYRGHSTPAESIDAAKAAAQADYEGCILAALSASPAGDGLKAGLPQSAASGAERELRAALERIVNPIGFMKKQADATGFKLDGHMAMTLSNDANYLKGIAQKALDALPASGDGPDAGHAAARSSSTEAVEQEVERLRAVEAAAQSVLTDWTKRLMDGEEKFIGGEYGSFWSPHASMVTSEKMAALRAAIARPSPAPAACKPEGETHG